MPILNGNFGEFIRHSNQITVKCLENVKNNNELKLFHFCGLLIRNYWR